MSSYHILIVDDQKDIRRVLVSGLQTLGQKLDVIEVPSAEEAMLLAPRRTFDLIVTDVRLPGISGLDLVKRRHEGPFIDLKNQVAAFDLVALLESDAGKLAIHARFNGDAGKSARGADSPKLERDVLLGGARRCYRHRKCLVSRGWNRRPGWPMSGLLAAAQT